MKKIALILLPIAAIVLETFDTGVMMNFGVGPSKVIYETYSYFNLLPLGYGNISPFITAILTCILVLLALLGLIKENLYKSLFLLSLAACFFSIIPALNGVDFLTYPSLGISIILVGETALARTFLKYKKEKRVI